MKPICGGDSPWDLSSRCIRDSWFSVIPVVVVAFAIRVMVVPNPPPISHVVKVLKAPFQPFLTLSEAEALLIQDEKAELHSVVKRTPVWPTAILSLAGLVGALVWIVLGSYLAIVEPINAWQNALPFLVAVSWLYASVRPILKPTATPPYDLFILYVARVILDTLVFGGVLYDKQVYNIPLPSPFIVAALVVNLVAGVTSLLTVLSMPLAIPSARVDPAEIVRNEFSSNIVYSLACRANPSLPKIILPCGGGSASTG